MADRPLAELFLLVFGEEGTPEQVGDFLELYNAVALSVGLPKATANGISQEAYDQLRISAKAFAKLETGASSEQLRRQAALFQSLQRAFTRYFEREDLIATVPPDEREEAAAAAEEFRLRNGRLPTQPELGQLLRRPASRSQLESAFYSHLRSVGKWDANLSQNAAYRAHVAQVFDAFWDSVVAAGLPVYQENFAAALQAGITEAADNELFVEDPAVVIAIAEEGQKYQESFAKAFDRLAQQLPSLAALDRDTLNDLKAALALDFAEAAFSNPASTRAEDTILDALQSGAAAQYVEQGYLRRQPFQQAFQEYLQAAQPQLDSGVLASTQQVLAKAFADARFRDPNLTAREFIAQNFQSGAEAGRQVYVQEVEQDTLRFLQKTGQREQAATLAGLPPAPPVDTGALRAANARPELQATPGTIRRLQGPQPIPLAPKPRPQGPSIEPSTEPPLEPTTESLFPRTAASSPVAIPGQTYAPSPVDLAAHNKALANLAAGTRGARVTVDTTGRFEEFQRQAGAQQNTEFSDFLLRTFGDAASGGLPLPEVGEAQAAFRQEQRTKVGEAQAASRQEQLEREQRERKNTVRSGFSTVTKRAF